MAEQRIVFNSSLPRSGSSLLQNILAQNPRFEATATSSILGIIMNIREQWDPLFAATPNEQGKIDVMRGVLHSFYQRFGVKLLCIFHANVTSPYTPARASP